VTGGWAGAGVGAAAVGFCGSLFTSSSIPPNAEGSLSCIGTCLCPCPCPLPPIAAVMAASSAASCCLCWYGSNVPVGAAVALGVPPENIDMNPDAGTDAVADTGAGTGASTGADTGAGSGTWAATGAATGTVAGARATTKGWGGTVADASCGPLFTSFSIPHSSAVTLALPGTWR
jgi:hypothetical protein